MTCLQDKKWLHQVRVEQHGPVYKTWGTFGQQFKVRIMGCDDPEGSFSVQVLQRGLGNGTTQLWFGTCTKFVD